MPFLQTLVEGHWWCHPSAVKHHFVAERRKVLQALTGSKAKVVMHKPQAPRHIQDCAPSVTESPRHLNVKPATPVPNALVVTSEAGRVMSDKSKSQR